MEDFYPQLAMKMRLKMHFCWHFKNSNWSIQPVFSLQIWCGKIRKVDRILLTKSSQVSAVIYNWILDIIHKNKNFAFFFFFQFADFAALFLFFRFYTNTSSEISSCQLYLLWLSRKIYVCVRLLVKKLRWCHTNWTQLNLNQTSRV